jgi:GWxTD domain-containing protein
MNSVIQALEFWVSGPPAHALGWTLVHSLWEGAIVAAMLAAVLWTVDSRSSRLRYGLSTGALALLPLAFAFTFTVLASGQNPVRTAVRQAVPLYMGAPAPVSPWLPSAAADPLAWLAPLWLAGVLVCYGRSLAGWVVVERLRRHGVCAAPSEWQERLRALAAQLKLSRSVMLLESCRTEMPVVVGVLRPAILAPLGLLTGLPAGQVEAILLHELAHVRRFDYAVNLAQTLIEGLLFYHPAVWWISRVVRTERENCCDDAVMALRPDARVYTAALARLETNRSSAAEAALAAGGGSIVTRIRRLLEPPAPRHPAAAPVLGMLLTIVTLAGLAAWAQQVPRTEGGPYAKWVNEDVSYIIAPQEREAFQRLQTDQERERFVAQFWLRRDPTPGTVTNEFKEEHYRRIGYANQHFAAASLEGWESDRGHIYIVYGPPDELESHPAAASSPAYQEWLYHHIDGVGDKVIIRFDDPNGLGEYRTPKFYMDGFVNRPGVYDLMPSETVLAALANAGGFLPAADRDNIRVLRGPRIIPFNYRAALAGLPGGDLILEAGDLLIVPSQGGPR